MWPLCHSPCWWDGEDNQKQKAKLVAWDKNSLTERQKEKKIIINNTDKKNIQDATFSPPDA